MRMEFLGSKKWDGKFQFPNVYCLTFPMSNETNSWEQSFYKNGAIILVDAFYPEQTIATVTVSSIPDSQNPQEAIGKIKSRELENEKKLSDSGIIYKVSESTTKFGQTISIIDSNPVLKTANGPFPLIRSFLINQEVKGKQPLLSMSAHRLFVRGHDRFEISVIQINLQKLESLSEVNVSSRLNSMADEMLTSLQECTSSMPIRTQH